MRLRLLLIAALLFAGAAVPARADAPVKCPPNQHPDAGGNCVPIPVKGAKPPGRPASPPPPRPAPTEFACPAGYTKDGQACLDANGCLPGWERKAGGAKGDCAPIANCPPGKHHVAGDRGPCVEYKAAPPGAKGGTPRK